VVGVFGKGGVPQIRSIPKNPFPQPKFRILNWEAAIIIKAREGCKELPR